MAQKCALCKAKIQETFLGKILGTFVNKKPVCSACQQKHKDKLKEQF